MLEEELADARAAIVTSARRSAKTIPTGTSGAHHEDGEYEELEISARSDRTTARRPSSGASC